MAIKFQTNIPQTLYFPYGDFREVNGQYGQQFMYTVEVNGHRDKLYAVPNLHAQLQAAGLGAGSTFTITKVEGEGNRKNWLLATNGNGHHPAADAGDPANGSPESNGQPQPDFATLNQLMTHCLRSAQNAWQGMGETVEVTSDDIRRTALSLFIECSRRGIHPEQPSDQTVSAPSATIPPDVEDDDDLPF